MLNCPALGLTTAARDEPSVLALRCKVTVSWLSTRQRCTTLGCGCQVGIGAQSLRSFTCCALAVNVQKLQAGCAQPLAHDAIQAAHDFHAKLAIAREHLHNLLGVKRD